MTPSEFAALFAETRARRLTLRRRSTTLEMDDVLVAIFLISRTRLGVFQSSGIALTWNEKRHIMTRIFEGW